MDNFAMKEGTRENNNAVAEVNETEMENISADFSSQACEDFDMSFAAKEEMMMTFRE